MIFYSAITIDAATRMLVVYSLDFWLVLLSQGKQPWRGNVSLALQFRNLGFLRSQNLANQTDSYQMLPLPIGDASFITLDSSPHDSAPRTLLQASFEPFARSSTS
jgi:hypothetical protein